MGFTGTPIDSTLDVFGEVVDSYSMNESIKDEITVPIIYEGRAAKVLLDNLFSLLLSNTISTLKFLLDKFFASTKLVRFFPIKQIFILLFNFINKN